MTPQNHSDIPRDDAGTFYSILYTASTKPKVEAVTEALTEAVTEVTEMAVDAVAVKKENKKHLDHLHAEESDRLMVYIPGMASPLLQ